VGQAIFITDVVEAEAASCANDGVGLVSRVIATNAVIKYAKRRIRLVTRAYTECGYRMNRSFLYKQDMVSALH
jgi:hypothetical protein